MNIYIILFIFALLTGCGSYDAFYQKDCEMRLSEDSNFYKIERSGFSISVRNDFVVFDDKVALLAVAIPSIEKSPKLIIDSLFYNQVLTSQALAEIYEHSFPGFKFGKTSASTIKGTNIFISEIFLREYGERGLVYVFDYPTSNSLYFLSFLAGDNEGDLGFERNKELFCQIASTFSIK